MAVRAALQASGLDHGPISVHDTMRMMGLEPVPSTASLARIFREAGVARLEPLLTSWKATPKADAPPIADRPAYAPPADAPAGARIRTVTTSGTIALDSVSYKVDVNLAFQQVLVIPTGTNTGDPIIITDFHSEVLAEHTRPAPGIRYVGNGQRPGPRPRNPEP